VEPAPDDGSSPWTNYENIRKELVEFDKTLGERQEIVTITKADLPEAEDVQREFADKLGRSVHLISAATGFGLKPLTEAIANIILSKGDHRSCG
jgi:GTP-binding protein